MLHAPLPVGFALLAAVFLGFREQALAQRVANAAASVTPFILVPVPPFILMGELFFRTGLAVRVFDAFDKLLGGVPARLSHIAVGSGAAFASLTGPGKFGEKPRTEAGVAFSQTPSIRRAVQACQWTSGVSVIAANFG